MDDLHSAPMDYPWEQKGTLVRDSVNGPEDLIYRDFAMSDVQVLADDGSEAPQGMGVFEGLAAVFGNVDSYGEVIDAGAFSKTLKERKGGFPILWQHDPYNPIGLDEHLQQNDRGLAAKGQLNLEVQQGREAYSLLKQKALRGLSIGFQVLKDEVVDNVLHLKEIRLWEYSLVTFPANPLAQVARVKSFRSPAAAEAAMRRAADYLCKHYGTEQPEEQLASLLMALRADSDQPGDPPTADDLAAAALAGVTTLAASIKQSVRKEL